MSLRQTTLGEALGCKGDGRHYYIFRDYASSLEYIRNGRELCNEGLFVEMEAYEYHAYLDFREVWDDEFGTWGTLCHQLQGRPVESIDEEVKLVRFAPLIDSLEDILDRNSGLLTGDFSELDTKSLKKIRDSFSDDLERFLGELAALAGMTGTPQQIVKAVAKELLYLESLDEGKTQTHPVAGYTARLLAFAWLCLHRAGELEQGDDPAAVTTELVERFGLSRPVRDELYAEGGGADDPMATLDVMSIIRLFKAMLHWQELLALPVKDQEEWLEDLLADRNVAAFIGCHRSGPHSWFVKERWEMLVAWLELTTLVNEVGLSRTGKLSAVRGKAVAKGAAALIKRAETAGYRVDLFMNS